MNEQETSFTVFADYPGGCHGNFNDSPSTPGWGGLSLSALIEKVVTYRPGITPVAWAHEGTRGYGGMKSFEELRAESIAAGRLIEKTASGWVALGAEKQEEKPPFVSVTCKRELRKVEPTSADLAMIARDGPARIAIPKPRQLTVRVQSTAKPNPFAAFRSPDCDSGPSDHLNASRHQMAGMKG